MEKSPSFAIGQSPRSSSRKDEPSNIFHRYNGFVPGCWQSSGSISPSKPFQQAISSLSLSSSASPIPVSSLSVHWPAANEVPVISNISCCVEFVSITGGLVFLCYIDVNY